MKRFKRKSRKEKQIDVLKKMKEISVDEYNAEHHGGIEMVWVCQDCQHVYEGKDIVFHEGLIHDIPRCPTKFPFPFSLFSPVCLEYLSRSTTDDFSDRYKKL